MNPLDALSSFRHHNRVLLLLAPAVQSPAYEQQISQFVGQKDACDARDLIIGYVLYEGESRVGNQTLDKGEAAALRTHFEVDDDGFLAVLIGKDGTEKARYDAPVASHAVFQTIDEMPMRRQERNGDA